LPPGLPLLEGLQFPHGVVSAQMPSGWPLQKVSGSVHGELGEHGQPAAPLQPTFVMSRCTSPLPAGSDTDTGSWVPVSLAPHAQIARPTADAPTKLHTTSLNDLIRVSSPCGFLNRKPAQRS
jgi:hypothetical protein